MDLEAEDYLGIAAQLLAEDGATQAVALILDITNFRLDWFSSWEQYRAVAEVETWLIDRFTEEVRESILWALREAARDEDFFIFSLDIRRPLPSPDGWRQRVTLDQQGPAVTNQVRLVPIGGAVYQADGLRFRSRAEMNVFDALKRAWTNHGPFSVVPNTLMALPGHTWEVDFLVGHRGRVGVIEVDGPHHKHKWASDRSRDRLLEDAGIAYIDRIDAEDTGDPSQVDQFVGRFLQKLSA
jgi:hypothetical protein